MRIPVSNLAALCAVVAVALVAPTHAQGVANPGDARVIVKFKPESSVLKLGAAGVAAPKEIGRAHV